MFNSHVLEVVAGLCFIFFVVSVFVSAVNEWISALLALRARDLETGLKNLLGEDVQSEPVSRPAVAPAANQTTSAAQPIASSKMASALLSHPLIENVSPVKVL